MYNYDLSGRNKYYTLYSLIRDDILRGKIRGGERLPSKRAFAAELGVSVVTVQLAYDQLLAEGYISSKERSGFFAESVAEGLKKQRPAAVKKEETKEGEKFIIDLVHGNTPPNMFPFSVWARLIRGVLSDVGEHLLERVPCDGDKQLKRAISAYLYRSRGIDADPRYIVVGAGAEHLYGVIVQLLGRDKIYAVENPGYGKISSTYALNGARFTPVGVTDKGIDISVLENSGAFVAHVSPSHQFPTGVVTPVSARSRLIEWAKSSGGYIVEDDYDSEFRLTGKPLQCMCGLCPEKVIYMNTFSKSLAPSMRLGYMVLPPELYERFLQIFSSSANFVPLFEQKALAQMLDGGYFERHINRLRNYYRTIHGALIKKLAALPEKCEVVDTGSGLHVIAKFPDAKSDGQIKLLAAARGIRIKCLSDYLLAPMAGVEGCAVINYSGLTQELLSKI
ncbi:MAG: PLP-dependent aminotransferase family protein [Clostridia bacterium]|nr:PLP-dependent aminotransferase family protein [Clostridia bacterium]